LINVLDPEIILLGGGIAAAGPLLFDPLRIELSRIEWRPDGGGVKIVPAMLGEWAGAVGAGRIAWNSEGDNH
jgi:glucokinase